MGTVTNLIIIFKRMQRLKEHNNYLENKYGEENDDVDILYEEDVRPGLTFMSKEDAMKSLKYFFADRYHPCVVSIQVSNEASNNSNEKKNRETIRFVCTHGRKRKITGEVKIVNQNANSFNAGDTTVKQKS